MLELVNTSLPNGLLPGTHGFATVAMTRGLADNLRRRLEDLSAYVHKTSAHDSSYETLNPVAWSHLILPRGEHVLGRVAAAPFDYTGRTNRLARLLCIQPPETAPANAAEALLRESAYFSAPWEGEARWLEPDAGLAARFGLQPSRASRRPEAWINAFGEADGSHYAAGFAAMLRDATHQNGRPVVLVTSQQSDPDGRRALAFISDLIALLPEDLQPSATFSTYPCAIPVGVKCAIRVLRKDDQGYAQAIAGTPVADIAGKTVANASFLPRDADLEHLAATGSLPATKDTPQSLRAPSSPAASLAADGSIHVSIEVPPSEESAKAIAVSGTDISRNKPTLLRGHAQPAQKQRSIPAFDPSFAQPRRKSNGLLIAAISIGVLLLVNLAAFVVLQGGRNTSISGGDASVKTAQEDEVMRKKEDERKKAQAQQKEEEERKRPQADEAARAKAEQEKRERREKEKAAKASGTTAKAASSAGEAKPLYDGITEIVLCMSDEEAKEKFGHPKKSGLSAGSVWYYEGASLKKFPFSDKDSGKGKNWVLRDDTGVTYDLFNLNGLPKESETLHCRIWRFDKKGETLYCVTGHVNFAEFDLAPPYGTSTVNLAERILGPDRRVLAQWEAHFGKVKSLAWAAEGTNRLDWQGVDAASFAPLEFIKECHALRKAALDKELEAARARLQRAEDPQNRDLKTMREREKNLKTQIADATADLNAISNSVNAAQTDRDNAAEEKKTAEKAHEDAKNKVSSIDGQIKSAKHSLNGLTKKSEKEEVKAEIKRLEDEKAKAETEEKAKKDALNAANDDLGKKEDTISSERKKWREKKTSLQGLQKNLKEVQEKLHRESPDVLKPRVAAIEADINAFPSVEDAQRQWTIHVKVDLGGVKQ